METLFNKFILSHESYCDYLSFINIVQEFIRVDFSEKLSKILSHDDKELMNDCFEDLKDMINYKIHGIGYESKLYSKKIKLFPRRTIKEHKESAIKMEEVYNSFRWSIESRCSQKRKEMIIQLNEIIQKSIEE